MFGQKYLALSPDEVPDYETIKQKTANEILALFAGFMNEQQSGLFLIFLIGVLSAMPTLPFQTFTETLRSFCNLTPTDQMLKELIEEFISKGNIIVWSRIVLTFTFSCKQINIKF